MGICYNFVTIDDISGVPKVVSRFGSLIKAKICKLWSQFFCKNIKFSLNNETIEGIKLKQKN